MTTIIQSHTYSINFDEVCYFRETDHDQTLFTMTNGKQVRITCPYDEVIRQIANSVLWIGLEYPVRSEVFID